MSSTPCKSLKKDGAPCRGNGLEQLDGYCIAHAPAGKAWQWRSRGGKASSAAARADKRIPDRLRRDRSRPCRQLPATARNRTPAVMHRKLSHPISRKLS